MLAAEGRDVIVVERKPDFGAPARTWIVTPALDDHLGRLPPHVAIHTTDTIEMFAGRARASVPLHPPDRIVERSALLLWLADRARAAGTEIRLSTDVRGIRRTAEGLEVTVTGGVQGREYRLRTRHLIGADGTRSTVAEHFGARPQKVVPIVQAKVELPAGYAPGVTRVWFDREGTRFFYWLIPESDSVGVAGLVPESTRTARPDLDRFLDRHGLRLLEYQGAVIPLHQPTRRIAWRFGDNRVLLVGDAAAHVKVTTVGGVVSGVWGAAAAARALIRGSSYSRELWGLHRELWLHDLMRWSMDRADQEAYVRMLEMMNKPLTRLLSRRNRDSMAGAVWQLMRAQPGILGLGLRSVFTPYRALDGRPGARARVVSTGSASGSL